MQRLINEHDINNHYNYIRNLFLELSNLDEKTYKKEDKKSEKEYESKFENDGYNEFINMLYIWTKHVICKDKNIINEVTNNNEKLLLYVPLSKYHDRNKLLYAIGNNDILEYLKNISPSNYLVQQCDGINRENFLNYIRTLIDKVNMKQDLSIIIPPFSFKNIVETIRNYIDNKK